VGEDALNYSSNVIAEFLAKLTGVEWTFVSLREEVAGNASQKLLALRPKLVELINNAKSISGEMGGKGVKSISLWMEDGKVLRIALDEGGVIVVKHEFKADSEVARAISTLLSPKVIKCSNCGLDLKLAYNRCTSCLSILPFITDMCPFCGLDLAVKKCPSCNVSVYSDGSRVPLLFKKSYARFRRIEV